MKKTIKRFITLSVLTASLLAFPVFADEIEVVVHRETAWTWLLLTYGILKLGQRLDTILNMLGIHVGFQGGNPFDEMARSFQNVTRMFGSGHTGGSSNGNGGSGVGIMSQGHSFVNGGLIGAGMRFSEAANLKALTTDISSESVLRSGAAKYFTDQGAQTAFEKGMKSGSGTNAFKNAEKRVEQIIDGKAGMNAKMVGSIASLTAERFSNFGAGFNTIEQGSVSVTDGKITGRLITSDGTVKDFGLYDAAKYEMPVGMTYGDNADPSVTNRPFDPGKDTVKIGNKTMYKVIQPDAIKGDDGNVKPQPLTVPNKR